MATSTITYKPVVILAQRRGDGTWNVKIRVTFKRVSRYLSTTLTATARDVTASGTLKGASLISANNLIAQLYRYGAELNFFALQEMDVDDVVRYIRRRASAAAAFKLDFFEFGRQHAATKKKGTEAAYLTALKAFSRFLGGETVDINDITYQMLYRFGEFLDNEPKQHHGTTLLPLTKRKKKGRSRNDYTRKIKAIYVEAQKMYNDEDNGVVNIPRNPFGKLELRYAPSVTHTAKSPEWIQRIISFNGPCTSGERFALDMYIISFALMGMNAADLLTAPAPKGDIVTYFRAKTRERRPDNAEHRVKIDPRVRPLIDKYRDPKGKLLTNAYLRYRDNDALDHSLRFLYIAWAKKNGVEAFTLYSARHSWATIARSSLVSLDKALVNECLVHLDQNLKMADIYIERDWNVLWDANKKVLDLFDWSNIENISKQDLTGGKKPFIFVDVP